MCNKRWTTHEWRDLTKRHFEEHTQDASRILWRCRKTDQFVECVKLLRSSPRQQLRRKKLTKGRIFFRPAKLERFNLRLPMFQVAPRQFRVGGDTVQDKTADTF